MHFHLPKPLHGWREFVGEVGIIVIGVMIALGAEQAVEAMRWHSDVAEARNTLDDQLASSAFAALERLHDQKCLQLQLDRMDALISRNEQAKIIRAPEPAIRVWPTSAWDSAVASGSIAHMNSELRGIYAGLFSTSVLLREMNLTEYQIAGELELLNKPRTLSQEERDHLIQDIARLRQFNYIISLGARQWLEGAKPLRLKIGTDDAAPLREPIDCRMPDQPKSKD